MSSRAQNIVPGPFDECKVLEILKGGVLLGSDVVPDPNDHGVFVLACYCNRLSEMIAGWSGPWADEIKHRRRIGEAIAFLSEALPDSRSGYLEEMAVFKRPDFPEIADIKNEYLDKLRSSLGALDALIAAVTIAQQHGLPRAHNMHSLAPRLRTRNDFDHGLYNFFLENLPGRSTSAAYRFIARVSQIITGEPTTPAAVKINVLRSQKALRDKSN